MDGMNREKFGKMPLRKKLQWLFQYYGLRTVVIIIVIFVLGYFVKSMLFPEPPSDGVVMIYSDDIYPDYCLAYAEEMSQETGLQIEVNGFLSSDVYGQAAFVTKVGVDQVDVVVLLAKEFDEFVEPLGLTNIVELRDGTLKMGVTARSDDPKLAEYIEGYLEKHI